MLQRLWRKIQHHQWYHQLVIKISRELINWHHLSLRIQNLVGQRSLQISILKDFFCISIVGFCFKKLSCNYTYQTQFVDEFHFVIGLINYFFGCQNSYVDIKSLFFWFIISYGLCSLSLMVCVILNTYYGIGPATQLAYTYQIS